MGRADHLAIYKWGPGQSGNPSGRPRKLLTRDDVERRIQEILSMPATQLQELMRNDPPALDAMIAATVMKGISYGDLARFQGLVEMFAGKSKATLEPIDVEAERAKLDVKEYDRETLIEMAKNIMASRAKAV